MHRLEIPHPLGPEPDEIDMRVAGEDGAQRRGARGEFPIRPGQAATRRGHAVRLEGIDSFLERAEQTPRQRGG